MGSKKENIAYQGWVLDLLKKGGFNDFYTEILRCHHRTTDDLITYDFENRSVTFTAEKSYYTILLGPISFRPYIMAGYNKLKFSLKYQGALSNPNYKKLELRRGTHENCSYGVTTSNLIESFQPDGNYSLDISNLKDTYYFVVTIYNNNYGDGSSDHDSALTVSGFTLE